MNSRGKKRISRFINRLNLKAECLMDDYVTWQEIRTIYEGYGLS